MIHNSRYTTIKWSGQKDKSSFDGYDKEYEQQFKSQVPSKVVLKIPFVTWNGWKLSLNHLHILGCLVEIKVYNPQLKKFDLRTINGYLTGYLVNSKENRIDCPSRLMRIIEARNANFLKNLGLSGSEFPKT